METIKYVCVLAAVYALCNLIADWMVKSKKVYPLWITVGSAISFVIAFTFFRESREYEFTTFGIVKSFSVYIPLCLYTYCNYLHARNKPISPKHIGVLFTVILALNIAETILVGSREGTFYDRIYIGLASLLAIATFRLRWEFDNSILGFKDHQFTISFGVLLSYLYLSMFPAGFGWITFLILSICYAPASRAGSKWFCYRAYSLGFYFNFLFILDFIPYFQEVPDSLLFIDDFMRTNPVFKISLLAISALCIGSLYRNWISSSLKLRNLNT